MENLLIEIWDGKKGAANFFSSSSHYIFNTYLRPFWRPWFSFSLIYLFHIFGLRIDDDGDRLTCVICFRTLMRQICFSLSLSLSVTVLNLYHGIWPVDNIPSSSVIVMVIIIIIMKSAWVVSLSMLYIVKETL